MNWRNDYLMPQRNIINRKSQHIADTTYPVLKDILDTRGETIENVVIPILQMDAGPYRLL